MKGLFLKVTVTTLHLNGLNLLLKYLLSSCLIIIIITSQMLFKINIPKPYNTEGLNIKGLKNKTFQY